MTSQYNGKPANTEFNLPAAVNVSSSTNATPIVVTTATPHNLQPGDYFVVIGAQDPNANGFFRAGTVGAMTVVLLTRDGFNVAGTLAGGAQGTLQSCGFGPTVSILSDGDRPQAALWNVPYSTLLDRAAWLEYFINFGRKRRRPQVVLANADQTINTTQGDSFKLNSAPGTAKVIKLNDVDAPVPYENERLQLVAGKLAGSGTLYTIEREDTAAIIATFKGVASPDTTISAWFEFIDGLWQLSDHTGYDSATGYGVFVP